MGGVAPKKKSFALIRVHVLSVALFLGAVVTGVWDVLGSPRKKEEHATELLNGF